MKRRVLIFLLLIGAFALSVAVTSLPDAKAMADSPPAVYLGSRDCQFCHPDKYDDWEDTPHANLVHGIKKKKDAQASSSRAIKETADDKVRFKFFIKGKKILITLYDLNGNGSATYEVWNVIGGKGTGHGKEQYLIQEGGTTLIAPIQYNYLDPEAKGDDKWVSYYPEHWYNNDGTLIAGAGSSPPEFAASQYAHAWERRCAGCHTTGTEILYDDKTGKFTNNSQELNIGCEACHGPGGDHAGVGTTPTAANIINPAKLKDQEGLDVCGKCHSRSSNKGKGKFTVDWPAKLKKTKFAKYFHAGDKLKKLRKPADITWGSDAGKWGEYATDADISKWNHQQYTDFLQTAHWKNKMKCWDCHTVHGGGVSAPKKKKAGGHLKLSVLDNTLCLSCHASEGFGTEEEIRAHTKHSYNPASSGTSRCVLCHYPATARSGYYYDIHSHTDEVIRPGLTNEMVKDSQGTPESGDAIPNGCLTCHSAGSDYGTSLFERWEDL